MPHDFEWLNNDSIEIVKEDNKKSDNNFIPDEEFSAAYASINIDSIKENTVIWKRAIHLDQSYKLKHKVCLFDNIEPDDICQGSLGDCWLLAAISGVSEFPNLINNNVFKDNKLSKNGNYYIKLFDVGKQNWIEIKIDDKIPCKIKKWYESN